MSLQKNISSEAEYNIKCRDLCNSKDYENYENIFCMMKDIEYILKFLIMNNGNYENEHSQLQCWVRDHSQY